ncbi:flavin-containing monooxygenase [Salinisphaera aquimarina]|uniref:Flavin-containing monooxygenase n=1 Tax=Salinisphaera aquimarina TaxID=2094031 RepID=A0ABV7ELV0_9GAMM
MTHTSEQDRVLDVLIVGAGISGIGMACHLRQACPDQTFAILERRNSIGGTWDLFRYPGIRSDSDMFSFGYQFRPWQEPKTLSDGASIRDYLVDTAREYDIEDRIRFGVRTTRAEWSSTEACWTLAATHEASGERQVWRARYLILCTGYYRYDAGFTPDFPGLDRFRGTFVHPQQWPEDLDYAGKKVVVIGSGATAITLVPAMAQATAHITMLQRSPSYIVSLPAVDRISERLQRWLPDDWVFAMARRRNIGIQRLMYVASRKYPKLMRRLLLGSVRRQVGGDIDMRHFTPSYDPWDERLCVVPNGDLFKTLRSDRADIVTDHIETFTESGLQLTSGASLDADIVISATGLNMQMLGDIEIAKDGEVQTPSEHMTYKGVLLENMPNLAAIFGYTNASWTLKADIAAAYVCRLLEHMRAHGHVSATPRAADARAEDASIMDALNSGYVKRASAKLPRQGDRLPWRVLNHYKRDRDMLIDEPIDDGVLVFDADADRTRRDAA